MGLGDAAGLMASLRSLETDRLQAEFDRALVEQRDAQGAVWRVEEQSILKLAVGPQCDQPEAPKFHSWEEHEAQRATYEAALARRDAAEAQLEAAAAALGEAFRRLDEASGGRLTAAMDAIRVGLQQGIASGRWARSHEEGF